MELETTLTEDHIGTSGLSTIEGWNPDVPSAEYAAPVLKRFAEQLADVDGKVEVSVQNLEYHGEGGSEKALVGRVVETDNVAAVAAPLLDNRGED